MEECFAFSGEKSETPKFMITSVTGERLTLDAVPGSISANEVKINVDVKDCYGLMSKEKANRLKAIKL